MRTSRRKIGSGSRTRTGDCSRERKVFKPSKLFWKEQLLYASLEQMKGIEPSSQPWQGRIITSILHLHGFSGARVGRALLYTTAPENGGDIQNRTEDERLQSSRFTIKLYRHISFPRIRTSQMPITTLYCGRTQLPR